MECRLPHGIHNAANFYSIQCNPTKPINSLFFKAHIWIDSPYICTHTYKKYHIQYMNNIRMATTLMKQNTTASNTLFNLAMTKKSSGTQHIKHEKTQPAYPLNVTD